MSTPKPIWIYWQNINGNSMPEYIKLCLETIKYNCGPAFELVLVNDNDIEDYLPKINPKYKLIKHNDSPLGHPKNISVKTAYLRTKLLQEYGGVWMDADTILLKTLDFILPPLEKDFFVACHKRKTINGVSNGFLASAPNGFIINSYVEEQERLLKDRTEFFWGEIGLRLLSPIVFSNLNKCSLISEDLFHPIIWENWQAFFTPSDVSMILDKDPIGVTLFNSLFKKHPYYNTLESNEASILDGDLLINKLLRLAL